MQGTMKVLAMMELKSLMFRRKPIPKPMPGEVLIKIKHAGISESDLQLFEKGRIGHTYVQFPFVLGHEASGEIEQVGEGVENLAVGDRVALEPGSACGKCEFCLSGHYNLCPDMNFFATPPVDGAFREYITYPADLCFKLPANMSTIQGALIEPLAVGLHAAKQVNAQIGQSAVILGCDYIGIVTMMALKAMGVSPIIMTDVLPKRLEMVEKLGVDYVIDASKDDAVLKVLELTGGKGVDIVVETAGTTIATRQSVALIKRGGSIVLVGLRNDPVVEFDSGGLIAKEGSVASAFRHNNMFPLAISAVASGSIPVEKIVSHTFKFDDVHDAMTMCSENKDDIVKGLIEF